MKRVDLTLPTFGFIVATRVALGFGLGLLASQRMPRQTRRVLGTILVAAGAASTVPAMMLVRRRTFAAAA
jgi:hypothetical protein